VESPRHDAPTCHCGQATLPAVAPTVEMEVDAAGLRLDGVAVWQCPRGHTTIADPDLAPRITTAIDDTLLVAHPRRLRRGAACGDCGAALTLLGRETDTPVPFSSPFGVVTPTVVATMVRCPDCGREQLEPDAPAAVTRLVDACLDHVRAGIAPA
jgi:hypothetical protein